MMISKLLFRKRKTERYIRKSLNISIKEYTELLRVRYILSDCRQSRLRNVVFATDFSFFSYDVANLNAKGLNGVPIIPFLCSIFASFFKFKHA